MKIFVYEYVCATISERPEAAMPRVASLMAEGRAMLNAAVEDCAAIAGAEVRTLDRGAGAEESCFRRAADWCDYALIIAPEFDRILETRCRWAVECGATLLGPPPDVVALCADKLALAELWDRAGVKTPATKLFDPSAFLSPVVVKPRNGAGSTDTLVFYMAPVDQCFQSESIIQPFISGQPVSVSLMIGPAQSMPLAPATQAILAERQGSSESTNMQRLEYRGGKVPIDAALSHRAIGVALCAANAVPGLRGYVGVDMILGDADFAVEINPRLTTSYIGLRKFAHGNLMESLIRVVNGEVCAALSWRSEGVSFSADGHVANASSMRRER